MNLKSKKVLLIDDESSIRRNLSLSLSQLGYDTEPCENGINGLKKLEVFMKNDMPPAAVVIDIQLPDIIGTKLARVIKFKYPGIPVILITGYIDKFNPEEISHLKVNAFMQKPFSADELVKNFENSAVEEVEPEEDKNEALSRSGYLLVKLDEDADYIETYRELFYSDDVVYCDATKGDYDMVLLVQGDTLEELRNTGTKKIGKTNGVKTVEFLEVSNPLLDESTSEIISVAEDALSSDSIDFGKGRSMANKVCSYVLLEVEREKIDSVYPALKLNENVVYCDYTTGKYNLVLFVQGSFYPQIDKFIEESVMTLDGILKIKKFPVINLFEM